MVGISVAYNPNSYVLTTNDGLSYTFDQFEGMRSISDRNGVKLSFTRDGITSNLGTGIAFERDADGRIAAIVDPSGNRIAYEYDVRGDLIGLVDQAGTKSQYAYSSERPHFLIDINNATGGCGCFTSMPPMRMEYDDDGRLIGTSDVLGNASVREYDLAGFSESIRDPLGNLTTYVYDERGNLLSTIDALGHASTATYDGNDNAISWTDANGSTTLYTYDGRGNRTSSTDALGSVWTWEYSDLNDVVRTEDAEGRVYEYEFDPRGNLVRIVAPPTRPSTAVAPPAAFALAFSFSSLDDPDDGFGDEPYDGSGTRNVTEFTYDEYGRNVGVTDAIGHAAAFGYGVPGAPEIVITTDGDEARAVYDPSGMPREIVDENGNVTIYEFDTSGRIVKVRYPDGGSLALTYRGQLVTSATDSLGRTATVEYDTADRKVAFVDPEGNRTRYEYNAAGWLVREIDANGKVTSYEYDAMGRRVRTVDAEGGVAIEGYDATGRLVSTTNPNGRTTSIAYDAAYRVVSRTAADGGVWRFTYDRVDNVRSETDPNGSVTRYRYDAYNFVTGIKDPNGSIRAYEYDEVGNLAKFVDANGHETTFRYDSRYRMSQVVEPDGAVYSYGYDGVGNLLSIVDPRGHTARYEYDSRNRVVAEIDPLGGTRSYDYDTEGQLLAATDERGFVRTYEYDRNGRATSFTDAEGGTSRYAYDGVGNLVSFLDPNGHATTYAFDGLNRLATSVDARGKSTSFGYDPTGNVISIVDPNGHATTFGYDPVNRLASVTDALGNATEFAYDLAGNTVSVRDPNGRATLYGYDKLNRLSSVTDALGHSSAYEYDVVGNLVSFTDPRNATTFYGYDAADRLVSVVDAAGGFVELGYDLAGNRVSFTDANGNTTRYAYDALDRLVAQSDPTGAATFLGYDAASNIVSVTDPLGFVTGYTYDKVGRLHSMTAADSGTTTYGYDLAGNTISMVDPLGRTTAYAYDELDRLVSVADPRSAITRYGYDDAGNLTSLTDPNLNVTQFQYDAADRRIAEIDPRGNAISYEYDPAGNVSAIVDRKGRRREFGYDAIDRRTSETWVGGSHSASYTYDEAGNLLTAGDAFSNYAMAYDLLGRLVEVDNLGTAGVPRVVLQYAYDAVGNSTRTSDSLGTVVDSEYDSRNLLASRNWSGGGVADARVEMEYDAAGQRTELVRFSNLASTQLVARTLESYDPVGRLTGRTTRNGLGVSITGYGYDYDLAGQVTSESHNGDVTDYSFDLAGQLVGANRTALPDEEYAYDAAGNPIQDGQTVEAANRIVSDDEFEYEYDAENNLVRKGDRLSGEITTYSYDFRNRLTDVVRTSAGGIVLSDVHYTYDAFDRLILRDVDGVQLATVYDGENPWVDFEGMGLVEARYLYGEMADEILARWRPGDGQAWYLADKQGTIREVIDASGAVVGSRDYDAFGVILDEVGAVDRFAFQSREWDAAVDLYQFRARWYDPHTQQFTSEDPLGFGGGDANVRRFVANNPLMYTDPSGMLAIVEYAKKSAKIGAMAGALCALGQTVARGDWTVAGILQGLHDVALGAAEGALAGLAIGGVAATAAVAAPTVVTAVAGGLGAGALFGEGFNAGQRVGGHIQNQNLTVNIVFKETVCLASKVIRFPAGGRLVRNAQPQRPNPNCRPSACNVSQACFEAGTPMLWEFGTKVVEDIRRGDKIWSRSEFDPSGPVELREVEEVFERWSTVWEIELPGGVKLGTTAEHPFYVVGKEWVNANVLMASDVLVGRDGQEVRVVSVTETGRWAKVYNFRIAEYHTYYVGAPEWGFDVWVHNSTYNVVKGYVFENLVENRSILSGVLSLFRTNRRGGFDLATLEQGRVIIQEHKFANKLQFSDFTAITTNLRDNINELLSAVSRRHDLPKAIKQRVVSVLTAYLNQGNTSGIEIRVVTGKVEVGPKVRGKLARSCGGIPIDYTAFS